MNNSIIEEDPTLPIEDESGWIILDGEEVIKEETTDSSGETTST